MRTLKDFLLEAYYDHNTNYVTFEFNDLKDSKDIINSLKNRDYVNINNDVVTIEVTNDNYSKLATVQDILQQYVIVLSKDQNNADQQNIKKFSHQLHILNDLLNKYDNPEEE